MQHAASKLRRVAIEQLPRLRQCALTQRAAGTGKELRLEPQLIACSYGAFVNFCLATHAIHALPLRAALDPDSALRGRSAALQSSGG